MGSLNASGPEGRGMTRYILSRRKFLASLVATGLIGPVLAACGGKNSPSSTKSNSSAQTPPPPPQETSAPNTGATTAASSSGTASSGTVSNIGKLSVNEEPYPKYTGTPVDSDLLTIIRTEDLSNINPIAVNMYTPLTQVYDPPIWIDEYTLDPKPWLAESWDVSPDGSSYTYHLRKDVKWHDGTPLTADDVAFTFIMYRDDPDSGVARFYPLMKKDPVIIDPHTVRFDLDGPSGDWILNASNQFVVQKKQFEAYWNAGKGAGGKKTLTGYPFTQNMLIGTGAWKQVKYNPSAAPPNIQYERNDSYFAGKPHFKRLILQEVDQTQQQLTDWLSGSTDLLWPVTFPDVQQVKNQQARLYIESVDGFMNAYINFKNPKQAQPDFFKSKQVRQALSTGIDRAGYAQAVFGGFVDQNAIGPVAFPWALDTNLKSPAYNQEKAQQMLASAGYKKNSAGKLVGSNGSPIQLVAVVSSSNEYPVDKIAVSVQQDFSKLGVDMQIQTVPVTSIRDRTRKQHDWDLFFTSRVLWAGFSDYAYYKSNWDPRTNPQGFNYGGWSNPQADKVLDQIIREPDLKKQKALLWQFQEIIADDLPSFWFGIPKDLILVKQNLLGYQPNAMWQYWDTWKLWRTA